MAAGQEPDQQAVHHLALPHLRNLSFDPLTHYVPPGEFSMELINVPGASDRYRIQTDAEAVLPRIPTLQRLSIPGFHWRNRVDPIAELRGLRWLHLNGWRNLRAIYRVLRGDPAALGMVVDWGYRPDDVPVRLFGAWTTLPAGPATLAARTGAIVLPVAAYHQGDVGGYRHVTGPPLEVPDTSPRSIVIATQAIADALESFVRAAPEQWHTFKPMWPATAAEAAALAARAAEMLAQTAMTRSSTAAHRPAAT